MGSCEDVLGNLVRKLNVGYVTQTKYSAYFIKEYYYSPKYPGSFDKLSKSIKRTNESKFPL